jgi:uncharacterized membrane protein
MTDRIIVATFNDTASAYEAARAIKALQDKHAIDFKLKTGVMVKKDNQGNVTLLETRNRFLVGTTVGTVAGALIGLLGGAPAAALGAMLGATAGGSTDAVIAGFDEDFVASISEDLHPGKTAIIVEADEKNTNPVDDVVALNGGQVHRQAAHTS